MNAANCFWGALSSNAGLCPAAGFYAYVFLWYSVTETCTFLKICLKPDLLACWTDWNATLLFPLLGYWRERYWGSDIYCITCWVPASLKYDPTILGIPFVSISILNLWHMHLELWIGTVIIFNLNKQMQVNKSFFFMDWEKKNSEKNL